MTTESAHLSPPTSTHGESLYPVVRGGGCLATCGSASSSTPSNRSLAPSDRQHHQPSRSYVRPHLAPRTSLSLLCPGTGYDQHPQCCSTFYTPPSVLRKPRWSLPLATRAPSSLRISKSCRLNSLLRVTSGQYGTDARCQGGTRLRKIDPCTRARRWIRAPSRTCVPRHAAQTLRNAAVCSAVLRPPATTASG